MREREMTIMGSLAKCISVGVINIAEEIQNLYIFFD